MRPRQYTKTPSQVRKEFDRTGQSFRAWALAHGYKPNLVYEVLCGRVQGKRGKGHEISVLLGIKEGEIVS